MEDSQTLISPHTDKLGDSRKTVGEKSGKTFKNIDLSLQSLLPERMCSTRPVRFGEGQSIEDSRQIPQVEDVVELGGSGWQIFDDVVVKFQCADDDFITNTPYDISEWLKYLIRFIKSDDLYG